MKNIDIVGFLCCIKKNNIEVIDRYNERRTEFLEGNVFFWDFSLHKFWDDEILLEEDDALYLLDGFITNKEELIREHCKTHKNDTITSKKKWEQCFIKMQNQDDMLGRFRGGFCGISIENNGEDIKLYCDHVGNRALYYYCNENMLVISNRFVFVTDFLHDNHVSLTVDEYACTYMLQQGFMIDDSTFSNEIKRVLPGQIVYARNEKDMGYRIFHSTSYYKINNITNDLMTEQEAIELLDEAFREAVRREFEKDKEYGYSHLVDLSGGLDSRMTTWVAHELGYTNQINVTYCKAGYLDQQIAQKIAADLKHEFWFESLDDFKWFDNWEELCVKNNGAALYSASTGANRLLKHLNMEKYGIEHTGMIGDAIVSTFYDNSRFNYALPDGTENCYSSRIGCKIKSDVLSAYPNRELYSLYTRGLLGAQTSYMIRQNYIEVSSPFLDVDFLNVALSIPFKFRKKHYIYIKWIEKKYYNATKYGWEKWIGCRPISRNHKLRKIKKWISKIKDTSSMVPLDYWYCNDLDIREKVNAFVANNMNMLSERNELKKKIEIMLSGSTSEVSQAITVIQMMKIVLMEQ